MVVFAPDPSSFDFVNIYPNPALHELFIELMDDEIMEVQFEIINMQGQMVRKGSITKNEISSIPLSYLIPGTYNLRIIGNKKWCSRKFVKL
jgi:hypothetical protein